jgi:hypothetical protein
MKAKQVKKEPKEGKLNIAETKHRYFAVGEPVRLQSLDSEGNYETGRVVERVQDYSGTTTHYQVRLDTDPDKIVKINVWFVSSMDSPERPTK